MDAVVRYPFKLYGGIPKGIALFFDQNIIYYLYSYPHMRTTLYMYNTQVKIVACPIFKQLDIIKHKEPVICCLQSQNAMHF